MNLESAAWHIAKAHPHGLHQIRLLKLLWLAELKHYERTGERLTDANWFRWDYGPYSKDVVNGVKADKGHFRHEPNPTGYGSTGLVILASKPPERSPTDAELETIQDILWTYERHTNQEILQDVYGDKFFEETPYSHDFDFTKLQKARSLNLSPQEERRILSMPTQPVQDISELFD